MKIEPVFKADIPAVIQFMHSTPEWGHQTHEWAFNHTWLVDNDHPYGMMLKNDEGQIVGFLGTIFSKREINGREQIYCNLAKWNVLKDYRSYASFLLKPLLKKDITITNYTPSDAVVKLLERMKFKSLHAMHSISSLITLNSLLNSMNNRYALQFNEQIDHAALSKIDQQIYNDHRAKNCICITVQDNLGTNFPMLLVFYRSRAKGCKVLNLVYASDYQYLAQIWQKIAVKIALKYKVLFIGEFITDRQIFKTRLNMQKKQNMLVYGTIDSVDFIYSEFVLSDLNVW